ncbi:MAG: hypothetical protein BGO78_01020 [Chloroflexi bacterium 44-23]|nr:MAG: hypothetical protein BGO78_01020 [Chloroflexi bacterium 44-23]
MESTAVNVVSVRFSKVGKLYNFDAGHLEDIKVGNKIVVETSRGWQLGQVAQILGDVSNNENVSWKKVDRLATEEDLSTRESLESKEKELVELARRSISEHKLEGVKAISSEISLDSSRVTILYSYEGDNKIDLRFVKYDVNRTMHNAQIELRQIGPRDVAKILGGMGACGLPTRCCSMFLTDFSSISIRMAKEQGISLTPAEITGMCGRLRCCLIYEYEMYADNRRQLPKRNKRVMTPIGEGKVVDVLPLKMAVVVEIPQVGRREFNNADIEIYDPAIHDSLNTTVKAAKSEIVGEPIVMRSAPESKNDETPHSREPQKKMDASEKPNTRSRNQRPKHRKRRSGPRESE